MLGFFLFVAKIACWTCGNNRLCIIDLRTFIILIRLLILILFEIGISILPLIRTRLRVKVRFSALLIRSLIKFIVLFVRLRIKLIAIISILTASIRLCFNFLLLRFGLFASVNLWNNRRNSLHLFFNIFRLNCFLSFNQQFSFFVLNSTH